MILQFALMLQNCLVEKLRPGDWSSLVIASLARIYFLIPCGFMFFCGLGEAAGK